MTQALREPAVRKSTRCTTPFIRPGLVSQAGASLLAPMRIGHARAFSLLAMARPLSAKAAKLAGLGNDVVIGAQVDEAGLQPAREIAVLPAGAVALFRTRLRGDSDDVFKRVDVETIPVKEHLQSDEKSGAIAAFLSRKI